MVKKRRKLSSKVYKHAIKTKDKGGSSRKSYIDWSKLKKDDEKLKFFVPKEGTNKINIIPFEVKSKLNPLIHQGILKLDEGESDYMLDVYVHRRMGTDNNIDVLCPKENYGKRCPLCEESSRYYKEGKNEEGKAFRAKRRIIMNVQPIVKGEAQELQIFEVSHYLFGKELTEWANECKDGDDIVYFADTEEGKVVKFKMFIEKFGKNDVEKFKYFEFIDREEEIDDDVIDATYSFDEALVLLSAEEIEKIMYGQDESNESDEEETEKESENKDRDEEEKSEKKSSKKDDGDEEEEKEKKSSSKKSGKKECPEGHKWGEAGQHKKDCKKCDEEIWDECSEAEVE